MRAVDATTGVKDWRRRGGGSGGGVTEYRKYVLLLGGGSYYPKARPSKIEWLLEVAMNASQ